MNRRGFISLLAGAANAPLVPWRGLVEPVIFLPLRSRRPPSLVVGSIMRVTSLPDRYRDPMIAHTLAPVRIGEEFVVCSPPDESGLFKAIGAPYNFDFWWQDKHCERVDPFDRAFQSARVGSGISIA